MAGTLALVVLAAFFSFLAQCRLAEPVTPLRWTGVGLIVFGVLLVGRT